MSTSPFISIIIPVYNEEGSILSLCESLVRVCEREGFRYEVLFVDDGSEDRSRKILTECASANANIKVIALKRNFGQTAALAAGLDYSKGDYLVTLDADGQNDPEDIPVLLSKIEEGYDLVNGWRKTRHDPFFSVRLPSYFANIIIKKITSVKIHDTGCSLKIFRRSVLQDLHLYGEMHRFIPALLHWTGANISEIEVRHHKRALGESKYSITKLPRVVLDLINIKFLISYSTRPIQIFGKFALYAFGLAALSCIALVWMKIFQSEDITGNPFLLLTVFLGFVGVQLMTMGLLGEINIRIYHESTKRKIYKIAE